VIDETLQDLAAAYALNALDANAARAFEADLARNPELRAFTDELCEAAAALAHAAPRELPSPELRERVLSAVRAEAAVVSPASPIKAAAPSTGFNLLPWALAAGFAVTTAALWFERDQWRNESLALRQEAIALRERDAAAKTRIAGLSSQVEALRLESEEFRTRDALAQVRIATLSAQVAAFAKGSAVIVWDPVKQRGIVRLANLPRPESGKDYQLWVIDPKYPQPVSGGVVPMDQNGSARVSFTTDHPIEKADKFAISVEPAGGVPNATGPIVLLGD
jgi:anti-sigma-K factor RskA